MTIFDWEYLTTEGVISQGNTYRQTVYRCCKTQAIKLIRHFECGCCRKMTFYKTSKDSKSLIESIDELIKQLNEHNKTSRS